MSSKLKVLSSGLLATIQDLGRIGYRRFGVPKSGALHRELAVIANRLVGSDLDSPVIEFFLQGPVFEVEFGTIRLSLSGDFDAELTRKGSKIKIKSWSTVTLNAGDVLNIGNIKSGKVGYIGISGGLVLDKSMDSYSTYMRGGFGGCDGKKISSGTIFDVTDMDYGDTPDVALKEDPSAEMFGVSDNEPLTIRVVLGPQDDYFTEGEIDKFLSTVYSVGRDSDRMGSRLSGEALSHHPDKKPEIISDGIIPGAIQVPGNGSPIVLLADGPTVGGYPKIATVISSDLSKFAVLQPGSDIRFVAVKSEEAEDILIESREYLEDLCGEFTPLKPVGVVDMDALYSINLVTGVIDANADIPEEDYVSQLKW